MIVTDCWAFLPRVEVVALQPILTIRWGLYLSFMIRITHSLSLNLILYLTATSSQLATILFARQVLVTTDIQYLKL